MVFLTACMVTLHTRDMHSWCYLDCINHPLPFLLSLRWYPQTSMEILIHPSLMLVLGLPLMITLLSW